MADLALERSSLFQLNVIIWATLPQPSSAPVDPILRNLGYRLFSIEQPLEASIAQRANLQSLRPPVSIAPVADVLLDNPGKSRLVVIECKSSSFGVESHQARQARGFILAGGDIMRRGLPIMERVAEVCYVVPGADTGAMEETLVSLKVGLQASGTSVCEVGAIGVTTREDGVYLQADHRSSGGSCLPPVVAPERRVLETDPLDDPRPLYVVPWIPESADEDLSALKEKLRSQLLSHIGRSRLGELNLRFDDLLYEVSQGVYGLWRNSSSFRGQVNSKVGTIVDELTDGHQAAIVRTVELALKLGSEDERRSLMEKIRTADVPAIPEGRQLPLEITSADDDSP